MHTSLSCARPCAYPDHRHGSNRAPLSDPKAAQFCLQRFATHVTRLTCVMADSTLSFSMGNCFTLTRSSTLSRCSCLHPQG